MQHTFEILISVSVPNLFKEAPYFNTDSLPSVIIVAIIETIFFKGCSLACSTVFRLADLFLLYLFHAGHI
uniref:Uncharacterized protein n=1 Tax=Anguilla anguilla TaxID=7936 RepID=A0A0E9WIL9_ANGAN